jgi:hypothetical protein
MPIKPATLLAVAALAAMPVLAHHAFSSEFDTNKPVTFEGEVTRVDWQNPHVFFYVDVKDANGGVVNWKCETRGPNNLEKKGWRKDTMKIGEKVLVHGYLARDNANFVDGRLVTLADGRKIQAGDGY